MSEPCDHGRAFSVGNAGRWVCPDCEAEGRHKPPAQCTIEERNEKSWIQTFTKKKFYPLDPAPEDLDIIDIAHALSNLCRFNGQTELFYSVAEHSLKVSLRCEELATAHCRKIWDEHSEFGGGEEDLRLIVISSARWGLLHDAAEAYLIDLPRPVKHHPSMQPYRDAEARLQSMICTRYNLPQAEPEEVGIADGEMLFTEIRDLMSPVHPDWAQTAKKVYPPLAHMSAAGWMPEKAKLMFLRRFVELFPEHSSSVPLRNVYP